MQGAVAGHLPDGHTCPWGSVASLHSVVGGARGWGERETAGPGWPGWPAVPGFPSRRSEEAAGDPSVERGLRGAQALSAGLGSPLQTACQVRLGSAAPQFLRTRRPEGGQWVRDPRGAWDLWRRGQQGLPPRRVLGSHVNWGLPESVLGR